MCGYRIKILFLPISISNSGSSCCLALWGTSLGRKYIGVLWTAIICPLLTEARYNFYCAAHNLLWKEGKKIEINLTVDCLTDLGVCGGEALP